MRVYETCINTIDRLFFSVFNKRYYIYMNFYFSCQKSLLPFSIICQRCVQKVAPHWIKVAWTVYKSIYFFNPLLVFIKNTELISYVAFWNQLKNIACIILIKLYVAEIILRTRINQLCQIGLEPVTSKLDTWSRTEIFFQVTISSNWFIYRR